MAKNKKKRNPHRSEVPLPKSRAEDKPEEPSTGHHALRETIESLAIAFMLAFFIRTFVAEAFVIPTGSMSPALQGAHKDLSCPQCGQRFRVNASITAGTRNSQQAEQCVAGMCPMCRYTVPFSSPLNANSSEALRERRKVPSYAGDRIVVNKFIYSFAEPERWDVVVFKYPGESTQNYIKRLVGLPGETIRLYQGDLFVGPEGARSDAFAIERKPPKQVFAMKQLVHDTRRDPASLHDAGWPLRWEADDGAAAWTTETKSSGKLLSQRFVASDQETDEQWLRYRHRPPSNHVWPSVESSESVAEEPPRLISDFNPYNTRINYAQYDSRTDRLGRRRLLDVPLVDQGVHWVGDLLVEADVDVQAGQGELILQLTEAGHRFQCRCDLASGQAHLEILPAGQDATTSKFAATAPTALQGTGSHRLLFANVDDALHLWIDDKLIAFDRPTTYDWKALFGPREEAMPQTSATNPGDLAPAAVGARGANLAIDRLQVWRDIYYIAASDQTRATLNSQIVTDYSSFPPSDVLFNPDRWGLIQQRRAVEFPLGKDHFFVMGDNSPQSQDARLWNRQNPKDPWGAVSKPSGNFLERELLIGRAISVVWPHTWYYVIPGFSDMRRIK
ncbi:MAG: signal peptidase I [Aeoliella sp.]